MFHINFNVGQCTTLEARLCTASIYNLCSAKQADAFQRLLNVDKISITPCSIRTISNNFVKTFESGSDWLIVRWGTVQFSKDFISPKNIIFSKIFRKEF